MEFAATIIKGGITMATLKEYILVHHMVERVSIVVRS
jgi:hypothetical protein